jgi:hypothetical protein
MCVPENCQGRIHPSEKANKDIQDYDHEGRGRTEGVDKKTDDDDNDDNSGVDVEAAFAAMDFASGNRFVSSQQQQQAAAGEQDASC